MKLLTAAIPCYNSQDYMEKCIQSLLPGGEDIEILIIDDGSTDRTAEIADRYEKEYPGIVRAIHKENGGHGSAVNTGIENATGLYFKVVDSDDWVKDTALAEIMTFLRSVAGTRPQLDMLVSNFVYDKVGEKRKEVMQYRRALPVGRMLTWNDVHHFQKGHYILMHSVIYRTGLLRECGLKLPEHCFYVDNLYIFVPLPYVKNLYYLDVNFYHYFIGRSDQSVNQAVQIKRLDQQIRVNKLMADYYTDKKTRAMIAKFPKLRDYMYNYLEIITAISSILAMISNTADDIEKRHELWEYIKKKDLWLYTRLRYGILGYFTNVKKKGARSATLAGYHLLQKFYHFN